jgi:leucyl aminopeptidase
MRATATTDAPLATGADTIAVGVFEGEDVAHDLPGAPLGALLGSGEARRAFGHLAFAREDGRRILLVGLGERGRFDAERARVAAATVRARAVELGARTLCWEVPHHVDDDVVAGLVAGTILAGYRFERYRRDDDARALEALVLSAHHDVGAAVADAAVVAEAQNAARELQDTPANDLTPTALGERARTLDGLEVEVHGRSFLVEHGMGAFAGVAQGSDEEPALIVARYDGDGTGPLLGLVGKAVTHDTGGLTLKSPASLPDMKYDMSGGAAVLEATAAIARLGLPVRVLAVVGATENAINGHALKPGDVVHAMDGTSIEVTNTDAEGRLVLADCLLHARNLGAERLVDVATLTGGIVTALGSVYAGLFADEDAWADALLAAGTAAGEELWRMPLHPAYEELLRSRVADLVNAAKERRAHPIQGATFLAHFAGDVPWAHVDIAGVAWDRGRAYAPKGGSGFGVGLLVELARALVAPPG